MPTMLKRPKRPLPRQFNRKTSPAMQKFVRKRHARRVRGSGERWARTWRKWHKRGVDVVQWVRRWFAVIVFVTAIVAAGAVLFSPLVRVRSIRIERQDARLDVEKVRTALAPLFGRHLLFLSAREIEPLLRRAVPDIDTVTARKHFPSLLIVRVTERPFAAKLVFKGPDTPPVPVTTSGAVQTGSGTVRTAITTHPAAPVVGLVDYLTDNGIYMTAPAVASGSQLPVITVTDFVVRPTPGTRLTSADLLQRMRKAEELLTGEFGYRIAHRTIYLRAREFHLATERISLWFDLSSPLEEQFRRYRTFLQAVGVGAASAYVDLRLAGQVVYR